MKRYALFAALLFAAFFSSIFLYAPKTAHAHDAQTLTLVYANQKTMMDLKAMERKSNIHTLERMNRAFGRKGSYAEKLQNVQLLLQANLSHKQALNAVFYGLTQKVDTFAKRINKPVLDADIKFDPYHEAFSFKKEKLGLTIDEAELYADIFTAMQKSQTARLTIIPKQVLPRFTVTALQEATCLRDGFRTCFAGSSPERIHNIKRAADKITGTRIMPNTVFSFNKATGTRSEENGYLEATIIKGGLFEKGSGGGVCQVSTTLYNAALVAGLTVVEAHPHSIPVSYVEKGFDAMVSGTYCDLKLCNNTPLPVFIQAYTTPDHQLIIRFFGQSLGNTHYMRKSLLIKTLPHPGDRIVRDTKKEYTHKIWYEGERARLQSARRGYQTQSFLQRYTDGNLTEERLLRKDTYKAAKGIILEGTEPAPSGFKPKNNPDTIPVQPEKNVDN